MISAYFHSCGLASDVNVSIAIDVHERYLSFPDLDGVSGFIPVMNIDTETKIDESIFMSRYGFVNSYTNASFLFRVIGFPVAALLLIFAGGFYFLYTRYAEAKKTNYSIISDDSFQNEEERLIEKVEENPDVKYNKEETKEETKDGIHDSTRLELLEEDSSP